MPRIAYCDSNGDSVDIEVSSWPISQVFEHLYQWRYATNSVVMLEALLWTAYQDDLPHPRAVLDVLYEDYTPASLAIALAWPTDGLEDPANGGHWPRDESYDVYDAEDYEPPYHHTDCECWDCVPDDEPEPEDEYEPAPYIRAEPVELSGDGPDTWPGLPEIPDSPPGRCRFGIEIEFNGGSRSGIVNGLILSGLAAREVGYTHEVVRYWKLTTDSTVTGGELVSPIMDGSDASIEATKEAIRIVKANGGQPSIRSHPQGMHVHMDVSGFRTRHLLALANNLRRGQQAMCGYVPPSRLTEYNRPLNRSQWNEIIRWLEGVDLTRRSERRYGDCPVGRGVDINFNPLLSYGTVECRLLGSTLNTLRVATWIRVLQTFVEASRNCALMPDGDILDWLRGFGLEAEHAERFRSVVTERGNAASLLAA